MITEFSNPIKELDNKVLFGIVKEMNFEDREFFLNDIAGKLLNPHKNLFGDKICSICAEENNLIPEKSIPCNSCFYRNYKLF